jgi:hypothetical protein
MPFIKHYSQPALAGILRGAAIANTYQGKERAAFMRALVAVALACDLWDTEPDERQQVETIRRELTTTSHL